MVSSLLAFSLVAGASTDLSGWSLLDDASHRAFNFFVERSHPVTGFTKDRSSNFTDTDDPGHVVASIASTGFSLAAYAVGTHRGWMTRAEAIKRARNTVRHMIDVAPKSHGWYVHWLNWETGKVEWNSEVSTIDSAIFWCGLMLCEQALQDPELTRMTNQILGSIDWSYMRTNGGTKPTKLTYTMGYRDTFLDAEWGEYSENAMLTLLGLGADDKTPAETWTALRRNKVTEFGKTGLSGGPLFMHQMSHVFFDFKGKRDSLGIDYWANSRLMTQLQIEYCAKNPKGFKGYSPTIWGLSACDIPDGYGAQGFPPGYLRDTYDNGTLAPPSALASMMFTPKESMAAAEAYYRQYRSAYGRYGFSSGINPTKVWHSKDMIGIDQGQMMLGIENARDGWPNRTFMSHPIAKKGMERAGFRVTTEGPIETRNVIN